MSTRRDSSGDAMEQAMREMHKPLPVAGTNKPATPLRGRSIAVLQHAEIVLEQVYEQAPRLPKYMQRSIADTRRSIAALLKDLQP